MDDIRECIGCNICVSGDFTMSPIRCTQNPSMGEEWRRGWHPETMRPRHADHKVLVIGAGPAGLRGYQVVLTEATRNLGGRVASEARLPGLAAWIRVFDYRLNQINQLDNVEVYRESEMARLPNEQLAIDLRNRASEWEATGLISVTAIADALAPSTIAAAVWDGRRFAEDLGAVPNGDATPFRREVTHIAHPKVRP